MKWRNLGLLMSGVVAVSGPACSASDDDPPPNPGSSGSSSGGKAGAGGKASTAGSAGSVSAGDSGSLGGAGGEQPVAEAGAGEVAGAGQAGAMAEGGAGGASQASGGEGGEGGEGGAPEPNLLLDPDPMSDTLLATVAESSAVALYFFGADLPAAGATPAVSHCTAACNDEWPVFYQPALVLGDGLNPGDFGQLTRPDGTLQTTFMGWPLYRHLGDSAPADRTGEGVEQLWHAAVFPFYTLLLRRTLIEESEVLLLATAAGHSIYTFADDLPGTASADPVSGCTSAGCRRAWPVVAPPLVKPVSSLAGELSVFLRADSQAIQLSYDGWPLYTYLEDQLPGDVKGVARTNWLLATP